MRGVLQVALRRVLLARKGCLAQGFAGPKRVALSWPEKGCFEQGFAGQIRVALRWVCKA